MSISLNAPEATFQVASIEMPCGAAILANVFAAWNFPVLNPWGLDTSELYQADDAGRIALNKPTGFEALMPVILERDHFHWRFDAVPFFHHRPADKAPALEQAVWLIRDPRDCLYSDWQRQRGRYPRFQEYLSSNWKNTGVAPATYLEQFYQGWIAAELHLQLLRVRFEDIKSDPVKAFRSIARHLKLELYGDDWDCLERHVDITNAKAASESLPTELKPDFELVRAGKAQEWRSRWTSSYFENLPDSWNDLIENLGYMPSPDHHN